MFDWPGRTITVRRHRLPHWETEAGTYFVTFRLADAVPPALAWKIKQQATAHKVTDSILDQCYGRCWLRDERIAKMVDDSIRHFDDDRYLLHAWTLMPNHVHVTFRALPGFTRDAVTHSWKSYTAPEANKILSRRGAFWQREGYDILIHDQNDLDRTIDYIVRNPVKAGLRDWAWTTVVRTEFSY